MLSSLQHIRSNHLAMHRCSACKGSCTSPPNSVINEGMGCGISHRRLLGTWQVPRGNSLAYTRITTLVDVLEMPGRIAV